MSRTYQWYWRARDGEADCGIFYEERPGHAYSVCRAPRYAKQEEWAEFASAVCGFLNRQDVRSQAKDTKRDGNDQRREHDEHKGETR